MYPPTAPTPALAPHPGHPPARHGTRNVMTDQPRVGAQWRLTLLYDHSISMNGRNQQQHKESCFAMTCLEEISGAGGPPHVHAIPVPTMLRSCKCGQSSVYTTLCRKSPRTFGLPPIVGVFGGPAGACGAALRPLVSGQSGVGDAAL